MKRRILSGIQPSGKLHIGNYFGAIAQHLESQSHQDWDRYFFIANFHALTTTPDPDLLEMRSIDVARTYLALGLDPNQSCLFLQSSVPEVCQLSWFLSCVTPMGLLKRCHSYKDKVARGIEASHGLFAYPVLQAADILIYDSNEVPVGKDQQQHVEVCRDIAIKLNERYGNILVVPEVKVQESTAVVPGTDGQKMSKSYGNTIEIFAQPKDMKAQVMSIVTDSKGLNEPKDPDTCNVVALYKLLATADELAEMQDKYRAGGYGYGHAKLALLEKLEGFFGPFRERYEYYCENRDIVLDILNDNGRRARDVAQATMARLRHAAGII